MSQLKKSWKLLFHNLFKAKGWTDRVHYNNVMIPYFILRIIAYGLLFFYNIDSKMIFPIVSVIYLVLSTILLWIFGYCLVARRNHDIGISKWFALIIFIPKVNWLYLLILMFVPTDYHNRKSE